MGKKSKNRNLNLDLLRVISCIAVVGLHTLKWDVSTLNSIIYYLQGFAVPIFIMSSGYILVNRKEISYIYIYKKILSILKIVCLWNLIIFLLRLIYKILITKQNDLGIQDLFSSIYLSLIQKGFMWHFWYLGAMILLYLFVLLLSKFTQNQKVKMRIWLTTLLICIALQGFSYILHTSLQKNVIQTFRIWSWIQYFLAGGLIPFLLPKLSKLLKQMWHISILAVISIAVPIYQYLLGNFVLKDAHAEYFYDDVLMIFWILCLFTFVMRLHLPEVVSVCVQRLSPLTMGVYIIHTLFIKLFAHFLPLNTFMNSIAVWFSTLVISFVAVYFISKIPVAKHSITL